MMSEINIRSEIECNSLYQSMMNKAIEFSTVAVTELAAFRRPNEKLKVADGKLDRYVVHESFVPLCTIIIGLALLKL